MQSQELSVVTVVASTSGGLAQALPPRTGCTKDLVPAAFSFDSPGIVSGIASTVILSIAEPLQGERKEILLDVASYSESDGLGVEPAP